MADKKVVKASGIATAQINPNATVRHKWVNVANAVGNVDKTYATSTYSKSKVATHYVTKTSYDKNGKKITKKKADKWKTTYNKPYVLAFHSFGFDLPSNARIKKIQFVARIKSQSDLTVFAPTCDFRINNQNAQRIDDGTNGLKTGWHKSHYLYVAQKTKLSTKWDEIWYTMDYADIKRAGITNTHLNADLMGCDLIWRTADNIKGENYGKDNTIGKDVYIAWVKCIVTYDVPDYKIDIVNPIEEALVVGKVKTANIIDASGSSSSPFPVEPKEEFELKLKCTNSSLAHGSGGRYIAIDVPWGSEIRKITGDGRLTYDSTLKKYIWSVDCKSYADYSMTIGVTTSSSVASKLEANLYGRYENHTLSGHIQSTDYYYIGNQYVLDRNHQDIGYSDITIVNNNKDGIRGWLPCCLDVIVHGVVGDTECDVVIDYDLPLWSIEGRDGFFSLDSYISDGTVEILSYTAKSVTLQVPFETEFVATLKFCFIAPVQSGTLNIHAHTNFSVGDFRYTFPVLKADPFLLEFGKGGGDIVKVTNHRVFTEIETDTLMIPMIADDIDASMIMTPCQINMNVWEDLDYIGCVPLEHLHFDPKSTYKDTLLNSTYKNKRYMGKKLATDEDITLNVRLHPKQVTTIQGLIEMDKPIPINANHKCFESDALNHRGWAEIYGIKTEETNPHWYKCDIDVKYLTHNLDTRFHINRGKPIDDYPIPSVLSEVFSSGENLSDTSEDKYFTVDTDGTFIYNEDYTDPQTHETTVINDEDRNFFNIDNGEHIHIQTVNPISHDCQIAYTWSASILEEYRENKISKIVKLVDKKGNSVFEYEYNTLEFITSSDGSIEEIQGTVLYRIGEETFEEDFTYRYDDGNDADIDDGELENVISSGDARYGSTLRFNIANNKISVIDEGFNGSEVYFPNIQLPNTEYYYVVEWRNNNSDGDTVPVDCTVDFQVQDTILSTTYANKFGKLLISPFPITDKKLLFTREAEEGTIYYYEFEEGKEYSYIVEPYYQYQNGTDLKGDDISIFNLNYGFDIVYIQNGLVRLGFNRVDDKGHMYLAKYDPQSESYVTTNILRLNKYIDLNVNSISDDKIELQASDSTFTIYRGHPYIKINHMDEDIYIDTIFNRVWAEQVGASGSVDIPAYWDLMNTKNLLPQSIGGINTINPSDIRVEEVEVDDNASIEMSWVNPPSTVNNEENVTFKITSDYLNDYSDEVTFEGNTSSFGSYSFEKVSDNIPVQMDFYVNDSIMQTSDVNRLNVIIRDWANDGIRNKTVYFFEEAEATSLKLSANKSVLQTGETATFKGTVHDVDGSLLVGEYVAIVYDDGIDTTGWRITCSKDKSVIQTGDSVTFTVTVKDANNNPVEDVFVGIYENNGE